MGIIAGKYRRRTLLTATGLITRPITDRVKETLFERLAEELHDSRVADIFAGTGTLGLEALSRGAASAVFVEQDRRACELLTKNVKALGVEDQTLCWRTDVTRCSFRPKGVEGLLPFDLLFCDPPYRMVPRLVVGSVLYKSIKRLARPSVSSNDALLVFRAPEHATFDFPEAWGREGHFDIAGMEIHLFRRHDTDSQGVVQ